MKKTFVTVVPNHVGAFLKASKCFAQHGININRVSYNKAVDSHMLFIDVEGEEDQLEIATKELADIGYLKNEEKSKKVILVEFKLKDEPGRVTNILELISLYNFNISYMSSQANNTGYQNFKMGLVVDDETRINQFIGQASKFCELKTIDYNQADRIFDNSIFYNNFVSELCEYMDISEASREELLINSNLAMQGLDEAGVSPYRTFDSISRFAELLSNSRGDNFNPRITNYKITDNTEITLIEPPCGSNTAIINSNGKYLFVDSGYACYTEEMKKIFHEIIPEYDSLKKEMFLTHADVDHGGLFHEFSKVYASKKSAECLRLEYNEEDGFREQNALHKHYIRICKVLTSYPTIDPERVEIVGGDIPSGCTDALVHTGYFDFGELHFQLYEGQGGHLAGESVLIDFDRKLVFSGDVFINKKDMTPEQTKYNMYAPILMTSVDTNPKLCAAERTALFNRLGAGKWHIFGGHGAAKIYSVIVE